MKNAGLQTAIRSAAVIAALMATTVILAGNYEHPPDKKAWKSVKDKLENGVVFADLADFEKVQLAYEAEDRVFSDDPERVFEEACLIYVELRYGSKMDRFRDIMAQERAYEDMVADIEARNEIAEMIGYDYYEEIPED
jgi:hypothetical protein